MADLATQPHTQRLIPLEKADQQAVTAALETINQSGNTTSNRRRLGGSHTISPPSIAIPHEQVGDPALSSPDTGIKKSDRAADAAASISWTSQKPSEESRPILPASASMAAAVLVKNHKPPSPWLPEAQNTSFTKAAAIAARSGGKNEASKPQDSEWGNSAATQAFKSSERSGNLNPQLWPRNAAGISRRGSLVAATGAMTGRRERSDSSPLPRLTYPDEANAAVNALSAAAHANKSPVKPKTEHPEPSATPIIKMPREMFTSHPPVPLETEEKHKADILRASALAMAKQMYSPPQKQRDKVSNAYGNDIKSAATSARGRLPSSLAVDSESEITPRRFNSLQEAAQKLAHERLAKLQNEHLQNRQHLDYRGSQRYKSRLSIMGRRRACSESSVNEDKEQSEKFRAKMRPVSNSLSQVDAKFQEVDREALMAVAQRNVATSLRNMDQKVLSDKRKVASPMLNGWEVKAHAAAQRKSESRMENYGKVDIGGGQYIDQDLVNQIAERNVRPVLEEINVKTEQDRVRKAEIKLEQDAKKRATEAKKAREKEIKEANRKLKVQDKEAERARKEAKTDQTPLKNLDTGKTKEVDALLDPAMTPIDTEGKLPAKGQEASKASAERAPSIGYITPLYSKTSMEMQAQQRLNDIAADTDESPASPASKGVKGWLKSRFGWHMIKDQKPQLRGNDIENDKASMCGAVVAGANSGNKVNNGSSEDVREACEENKEETGRLATNNGHESIKHRNSSVSSLSTPDTEQNLTRDTLREDDISDHSGEKIGSPPIVVSMKSSSPARDSRFHEEI